jgi:glycosyltransferase involved in cell wall biosynthesis
VEAVKHLLYAKTSLLFEVIVRDNCSEDNTQELLSHIKDPRLKYIRSSKNQGWATFLEAGRLARGDLITWLSDEDDFIFSHLEYVLTEFKARPECNVMIGGVVVGPHSAEVLFSDRIYGGKDLFKAYSATLSFSGCAGVFVRRTAFEATCKISFTDQFDAYERQNFYQIGFIATRCLAGKSLITTSRVVVKETRHAPTTDNWSVADKSATSNQALQPHYYPQSIYDRLISSLATVVENRYLDFCGKLRLTIALTNTFISNINALLHPGLIELLTNNYPISSVNAYRVDVENKKLHHSARRKLWILIQLIKIPLRINQLLKSRQRKATLN